MDCPYIPQIAYGDFSRRLHAKAGEQRIPISGSLELSFRCNLRCQHCYVAHGHNGIPGQQELSTAEHNQLLDQIVDEGTLWLLITGGDPLVRQDFPEIWTYAKRKGLLLTLFTNGTLITPRIADLLAEWRPFSIEITLYGHTQETYERVTGIPGSHARCRRGIDYLLERGLPLKLKTMALSLTYDEIGDMKAYSESLGLKFRYDSMVNAGFGMNDRPLGLRLSPDQVVALDLADEARLTAWEQFSNEFIRVRRDSQYIYKCNAGIKSFHVDPYGKLSICMMARQQEYDLRQGSFRDGWRRHLREVRYQTKVETTECDRCALQTLCSPCPGWSILEHNDPLKRVDYLCQVAHTRARRFEFINYEEIG